MPKDEMEYNVQNSKKRPTTEKSNPMNQHQLMHVGGILLFFLTVLIPSILDIQLLSNTSEWEEFSRFQLIQTKFVILIVCILLGSIALIGLTERYMTPKYRKIKLISCLALGICLVILGWLSEKEFFQNWFFPMDSDNFYENRFKFEVFLDRFTLIGAFILFSAVAPYGRARRRYY